MEFIIYFLMSLAASGLGFAIGAIVFFVWGLIGQRGEKRKRRMRFALTSALLLIACVLIVTSGIYFNMYPHVMRNRPDFQWPHESCSFIFSFAGPTLAVLSVASANWAIFSGTNSRKRLMYLSAGFMLGFMAISATNYYLIYEIQMPAYARFVMIEGREWKTRVGQTAPDIEFTALDGEVVQLSKLRGKVVLLNFFATWCGPCQHELPRLQEVWKDHRQNEDFRMFVISREEAQQTVNEFKAKRGFTFPMMLDPDAKAFKSFADNGIPRTYVISPDGQILYQSIGFAEIDIYQREWQRMRGIIEEELAAVNQ
jgi:peroxiredoxin